MYYSVYYVNILIMMFLTTFRRFPTTFRRFPKIFQNCSKGSTNVSEHFPNIFQRLPKIAEASRRFPITFTRCKYFRVDLIDRRRCSHTYQLFTVYFKCVYPCFIYFTFDQKYLFFTHVYKFGVILVTLSCRRKRMEEYIENNTWTRRDMEFIFECSHRYRASERSERVRYRMWTREDKFHISKHPCIILFTM